MNDNYITISNINEWSSIGFDIELGAGPNGTTNKRKYPMQMYLNSKCLMFLYYSAPLTIPCLFNYV